MMIHDSFYPAKPINTIEVYERGTLNIIKVFHSKAELLEYNKTNATHADDIVVNDMTLLGWDELDLFIN